MALTCDGILPEPAKDGTTHCRAAATTTLFATVGGVSFEQDLCEECAHESELALVARGARPAGARVDYKHRAAYLTASGVPFTAEEARAWLMKQGLAKPRGRLSKVHLQAYSDAH